MTVTYDPKASRSRKLAALWALVRARAHAGHHGVGRQLLEMALLWLSNGLRPPYYLTAGLYRKDLSWSEKRAHISPRKYRRSVARINSPAYHIVTNNKVVTHGVLATFGIPTPTFHGTINPRCGRTSDNRPLRTPEDLQDLLDRLGATPLAFKPVAGYRGTGFYKGTPSPGGLTLATDGRHVSIERFWTERLRMDDTVFYLCQDAVNQHPDVARFNPSSLNTIRAWMFKRAPGDWEMYAAVLRMGVGEVATDNLSLGGLGPRIDLATGRLRAAIDRRVERPVYAMHPTTGLAIEGATVPLWPDVLRLCSETCHAFPFLNLMAVDVAVGVDGPVVTEVESVPDEHQVGFDRGAGPLFARLLARGD